MAGITQATIETITGLGEKPGELGASTIVGSAAFNLLAITAVCLWVVPDGEERRVTQVNVRRPFRVSVCAARTLNTTGPSRVTLSLQ